VTERKVRGNTTLKIVLITLPWKKEETGGDCHMLWGEKGGGHWQKP